MSDDNNKDKDTSANNSRKKKEWNYFNKMKWFFIQRDYTFVLLVISLRKNICACATWLYVLFHFTIIHAVSIWRRKTFCFRSGPQERIRRRGRNQWLIARAMNWNSLNQSINEQTKMPNWKKLRTLSTLHSQTSRRTSVKPINRHL